MEFLKDFEKNSNWRVTKELFSVKEYEMLKTHRHKIKYWFYLNFKFFPF